MVSKIILLQPLFVEITKISDFGKMRLIFALG